MKARSAAIILLLVVMLALAVGSALAHDVGPVEQSDNLGGGMILGQAYGNAKTYGQNQIQQGARLRSLPAALRCFVQRAPYCAALEGGAPDVLFR